MSKIIEIVNRLIERSSQEELVWQQLESSSGRTYLTHSGKFDILVRLDDFNSGKPVYGLYIRDKEGGSFTNALRTVRPTFDLESQEQEEINLSLEQLFELATSTRPSQHAEDSTLDELAKHLNVMS